MYGDITGERLIGIPAVEDKIAQRSAALVLQAIYEADFKGISYGFRPNRGAQDALGALAVGFTGKKVNWMLDADIQGYFDSIDHKWLVKFIEHRVANKRVIRQIGNGVTQAYWKMAGKYRQMKGRHKGVVLIPAPTVTTFVIGLSLAQGFPRAARPLQG